ncbi:MAG: polysaccharide pyruvyl transferase family protein [Treponema sp.]|nr:polysaccharide pyruvyl transferase family protein [Treponema sp.]
MKTGILNVQWLSNHGSVLIAYAMQKYLDQLKIENEIIDFKPRQPDEFGEIPSAHSDEKLSSKEKTLAFENFRRKFLRRSKPLIGTKNADKLDYDMYIVGADTVWTPIRIHDVESEMFYLDFAKGKDALKISWAASIGAEDKKTLDEISPILAKRFENFDYLSVRERETVPFVQSLTSKKVAHAMDPVLMLEKEDFLDILPGVTKPGEDYIYAFLFNDLPGALDTVNKLSEKTGLPVVANIKGIDRVNNLKYNCENDGPAEYVERILNAKYVISDSYHAVIFAILGKRPFVCYTRPESGIRARNLLEDLGLADRFLSENERGLDLLLKPIDYDAVYEKKGKWKIRTEEYLRKALSGLKH